MYSYDRKMGWFGSHDLRNYNCDLDNRAVNFSWIEIESSVLESSCWVEISHMNKKAKFLQLTRFAFAS